jgi:hypothetical protein
MSDTGWVWREAMDGWEYYGADGQVKHYIAGRDGPRQRLLGLVAPPSVPPQAPTPPPTWGEPVSGMMDSWTPMWLTMAECNCVVKLIEGNRPNGAHCEAHSFADLVEGEKLLRAAQGGA